MFEPIKTSDGSFTLYSKEFNEYYHSTRDGAFNESLHKHVIPALSLTHKESLNILDINFGLGFNSLTTVYKLLNSSKKIKIYSPEIDKKLVKSINKFPYPTIFKPLNHIINSIADNGFYQSENIEIYIFFGDTRDFLESWQGEKFDIIYQDPFSPKKSPLLWSVEYFKLIKHVSNPNVILTTYSTATPVRLSLFENGFYVYDYQNEQVRSGTIASLSQIESLNEIDMVKKREISSKKEPIRDINYIR